VNPDHVNAAFEAGSACLLALNVRQLYRDKRITGVSLWPVLWFSVWGAWNLYYYRALDQTASWVAGAFVFWANTTWVALAAFYRFRSAR
jgi:hypothetical protein